RVLDPLPDDIELALEGLSVGGAGSPCDEDLLESRLDRLRARPDGRVVRRYLAPAEDRLAFLGDDGLEHGAAARGLGRITRQEDEAGSVMVRGREGDAERRALASEEGVRHLDQDARAVPRIDLAAAGPAVQEVLQHLQSLADDGVGLSPLHVDDEPDA